MLELYTENFEQCKITEILKKIKINGEIHYIHEFKNSILLRCQFSPNRFIESMQP